MTTGDVPNVKVIALANTLKEMADVIPDFEYDWRVSANGGGIDCGLYLNINIEIKEIEICNQPEYGTDDDDLLEDVLDYFRSDDEE